MKCFEPTITDRDVQLVSELLRSGNIGFGSNVGVFEDRFAEYSKKKYNIGLNSASSAAYCLFAYLYEKHGSCEVYTPSVGFASSALAATKNGHTIHFVDVDKNLLVDFSSYWNVKKRHTERQFNTNFNKSVFMPLLYGGVSDINGLIDCVRRTSPDDIIVVDSAHCINPTIESDYTFFSFHPTKPIAMSTGGLLSTDDEEANEYVRRYRNFGRKPTQDAYDIIENGFNFYMNNLNATLGLSQLDTCFEHIKVRQLNLEFLRARINEEVGYFTEHDEHSSYYLGTLVLRAKGSKDLRNKLKNNECAASLHYPFLHQTKFFKKQGDFLTHTESIEDRIINLPIHQNLTKKDLNNIINIVNGEK